MYTPDLKVAMTSATNGQRSRTRSHVRLDDDLRPLLQSGSGSRDPPKKTISNGFRYSRNQRVEWLEEGEETNQRAYGIVWEMGWEREVSTSSLYRRGGQPAQGGSTPQEVPPPLPSSCGWTLHSQKHQDHFLPFKLHSKFQESCIKTLLIHLV